MSVGRICVREVDLADADETILQVASRMRDRGVGTLVILDALKRPRGIITDRDLVERVLAEGRDPASTTVEEVMTRDPHTVSEGNSIESALTLMRSGRFRRLPVVDGEEQLVGLLSVDDVLMLLAEEFTNVGRLLERETPSGLARENAR
ncbi:CBS domain-containing protein [Candidatus Laterigemmans baculatus]|uniref:CBS domain-containing protein n=1 Tax=Candidatus Laterigemmans baculatus TaxID=2770505 RepID=UPI0013DC4277|nr:CBS domain-containing protein [Candidatus Laterigemmans baculatus]